MANKLQQQYPQFFELSGIALNDGYVYIGVEGLDPITNPVQIYLDTDLTVPIAQPLRTTGGYIYYNGSPVSIYMSEPSYSITVKNSIGLLIYTILSNNAFSSPSSLNTIDELLIYEGSGSVLVENILRGGIFVSKTAIEIDPYTKALYTVDNGRVFPKVDGGFWARVWDGIYAIPEWYDAKGDWNGTTGTDDSAVFNYLVTNKYNIQLKSKYYIATQIGNATEMYIDGVKGTGLYTNQDINLLSIRGATKLFQFEIKNIGNSTKKAITTSLNGLQLEYAQFENLTISGFKIAQYIRYSLWSNWKNIRISGCIAGLIFSGNDTESSFWDVRPNWNSWTNGFFHNQNSMDNILVEGGELGIFYCGTAAVFDNITTQNQGTKDTGNIVLPSGVYGTGLWTSGSSAYPTMLNINAFYTEGTRNPVRTFRTVLKINGFFAQGGVPGDKFKAVIINDSSRVEISNSWGQDYFENLVEFSNTYSSPSVSGIIPAVTSPSNKITGFGYYNIEKSYKKYKHFINHVHGTPTGTTYTLSNIDPQPNEVYKVSIVGISDGAGHRFAEYILYSGQISSLKNVATVSAGVNFTVTQNGFKPMITVNQTLSLQLTVYTEKVGAEFSSPSSTIIVA